MAFPLISVTCGHLRLAARLSFVLTVLVILMLLVWLWFGRRFIWRWWQYHMANREILFINKEVLIVRRPVSILGLTDAYDMNHLSPSVLEREVPLPGV